MIEQLEILARVVFGRTVWLLREVGMLILAFSPLDIVLLGEKNKEINQDMLLGFLGAGVGLFMASIFFEAIAKSLGVEVHDD